MFQNSWSGRWAGSVSGTGTSGGGPQLYNRRANAKAAEANIIERRVISTAIMSKVITAEQSSENFKTKY